MNFTPLFLFFLVFFIASCGTESQNEADESNTITVEILKDQITEIDDSLAALFKQKMNDDAFQIDRLVYHEGVNRCVHFYQTFPNDDYAPYALEKAAGLYDALQIPQKASDWRDTLIYNYPDYDRILFVLEQQRATYDSFDAYVPDKIELYINKMLELDDLTEEQREQLEFRLEHIDLKFMDIARLRNPELEL